MALLWPLGKRLPYITSWPGFESPENKYLLKKSFDQKTLIAS
jgi:hypothetical protein